jgi:hypothetical protein
MELPFFGLGLDDGIEEILATGYPLASGVGLMGPTHTVVIKTNSGIRHDPDKIQPISRPQNLFLLDTF